MRRLLSTFAIVWAAQLAHGAVHAQASGYAAPAPNSPPTGSPAPAQPAPTAPPAVYYAPPQNYAPAPSAPQVQPYAQQPAAPVATYPAAPPPAPMTPTPPAQPQVDAAYGAAPAPSTPTGVLLPAPPPGYVYTATPAVPDEQRAANASELQRIEARLDALKAERAQHGIGGPIALMAGGYATALGCSLFALAAFGTAQDIEHLGFSRDQKQLDKYDLNHDDVVNHEDEDSARRAARVMGTLSVIGAGVGLFGTLFFARRNAKRNASKDEILALKNRRRELIHSLQYGANVGTSDLGLKLSGRF
ncbi:MAG: hypothetical protein QM778_12880 [Myxococcales bacterium]